MGNLGFKKWAFLLLGTLFLISSLLPGFTEPLNKLPSLVNHYRHHVEEHQTDGLIEFLELHYTDNFSHRDEENHDDLPLYQINGGNVLVIVQEFPVYMIQMQAISNIEHSAYRSQTYTFQKSGGIFQPPRSV